MTDSGGPDPIQEYEGVDEVLRQILGKVRVISAAMIVSTKDSFGRVSAGDILANEDVPRTSISHMDGFAVRADDIRHASKEHPIKLVIRGDIHPGQQSIVPIGHHEAARVATGAGLPPGADTVVPLEDLAEERARVVVDSALEAGSFVYPQGEDVSKGDVIIGQGQAIRAQDVGLLLALGEERVKVVRKPKAAVLATGSELTDRRPKPGETRNSHSPIFLRLLEALGCDPVNLGIAKDNPETISKKISSALTRSDLVVTLGGTSVGRRDVVGKAVSILRPDLLFHGIRMDRGRVAGLALVKGKPILMMPGPIQGAMSAFILLAVPTIALLSRRNRALPKLDCVLGSDWQARKRFSNFTKVVYVSLKGGWEVADPVHGDTESISILSKADGFIVVPEDVVTMSKGSRVEVNLLQGFSFA